MGTETNKYEDRNSPEYLAQLLKDKKQIQAFPSVFMHLERLLDEEICKVRGNLFHLGAKKEAMVLPDADGPVVQLSEKLYVPVQEHPEFNFVGRILGPRGMTAKSLEQDTGCKIMVRGKGSMRDRKKEEMNRGKPNWEHLKEDLHVLITVEDTKNRGLMKLSRAVDEVKRLLVPAPEGEDALKKIQLMELAIMNGTYRDVNKLQAQQIAAAHHARLMQASAAGVAHMNNAAAIRSPAAAGTPIVFAAPRMPAAAMSPPTSMASPMMHGSMPPPLVSPTDGTIMYQYADPYAALASSQMMDYQAALEQSAAAGN